MASLHPCFRLCFYFLFVLFMYNNCLSVHLLLAKERFTERVCMWLVEDMSKNASRQNLLFQIVIIASSFTEKEWRTMASLHTRTRTHAFLCRRFCAFLGHCQCFERLLECSGHLREITMFFLRVKTCNWKRCIAGDPAKGNEAQEVKRIILCPEYI